MNRCHVCNTLLTQDEFPFGICENCMIKARNGNTTIIVCEEHNTVQAIIKSKSPKTIFSKCKLPKIINNNEEDLL